jgi:hypothetical protein
MKTKLIFIFITGLHNKPQGCGASVASAAGPFTTLSSYYNTVHFIVFDISAFFAAEV